MKINSNEAMLLAKEIRSRLKAAKSIGTIPPNVEANIKSFKAKQSQLEKAVKIAENALGTHNDKFDSLKMGVDGIYESDSLPRILQRMKEGNTPYVSEIRDKIILKAMFSNEQDMEAFCDKIVKEYSKKKQHFALK